MNLKGASSLFKHRRFIASSSDIWPYFFCKNPFQLKTVPHIILCHPENMEIGGHNRWGLRILMQHSSSKDQWKPVLRTACWWQSRGQAGRLSVRGSSKGTLLKKLWLTSGMIVEKHTAEQSFVGMAEVISCAAELAPVLSRRELYWCK